MTQWFSRLARSDSQDHPAAPVVYIDDETGTAVLSGDGADHGGGKSKSKAKGKKKKKGKHGRSGAAGDERFVGRCCVWLTFPRAIALSVVYGSFVLEPSLNRSHQQARTPTRTA